MTQAKDPQDRRKEELERIIKEIDKIIKKELLKWGLCIVAVNGGEEITNDFLAQALSDKVVLKSELPKVVNDNMEYICEQVHKAYCRYKKEETGEDYWTKGDYSLLKEEGKEYDRRTVRAVIQAITDRINKGE